MCLYQLTTPHWSRQLQSDNIYNEDPPANDDSYLNEYSEMETAYQEEITEYMTIVQEATAANDIAETLVMLVSLCLMGCLGRNQILLEFL